MLTRRIATGVALVAVSLMGACTQKEAKTVAYYTANPVERDQLVARCRNNPGNLKDDPDCINATDSSIQGWGKAKLPPVTFPRPSGATTAK